MTTTVWEEMVEKNPVIAVLVVDRAEDAVPLAEALLAGGIGAMELTLRTDAALDALRLIREKVPGMTAGTGTVLTRAQVRAVKEAGTHFAVAPGVNPNVLEEAAEQGVPFAPGIATPTDIEAALEFGCRILKFFPAEPSGGLPYLESMAAPYKHLGLRFIPLGGLNESNAGAWLGSPLVCAIGGSWIAPRNLIQEKKWDEIQKRAAAAQAIAAETKQKGV